MDNKKNGPHNSVDEIIAQVDDSTKNIMSNISGKLSEDIKDDIKDIVKDASSADTILTKLNKFDAVKRSLEELKTLANDTKNLCNEESPLRKSINDVITTQSQTDSKLTTIESLVTDTKSICEGRLSSDDFSESQENIKAKIESLENKIKEIEAKLNKLESIQECQEKLLECANIIINLIVTPFWKRKKGQKS